MKGTSNKLTNFMNQMFHFDPDNMEMGAKAVCQLVVSGELKLEQNKQIANQIRQAFIKQMQLDNYNVHAHAIKCIADMVPKLPAEQVQKIFEKIIKSIANKELDQKKRQIYGICAGTVIHQAAQQYGHKLSDLFVQSIKELMISKDQNNQIQIILINVISQFMRKWQKVASDSKNKFDMNSLVIYLLRNIEIKTKLQIVKKSQTALGKIASILNKNNLQVVFNHEHYGLMVFLKDNYGKFNIQNMKKMRNGLLTMVNILKTHNNEIKYYALNIANLIIMTINTYKSNDNIDNIDLTFDILDCSIVCLFYLVKSYSKEFQSLFNQNEEPFTNFVYQLVNFDMEGQINYIVNQDSNMQIQKDQHNQYDDYYQEDQANQEKGWKVRRATLNYITILIKKNKVFKQKLINSSYYIKIITQKLIQTNSMVSQMAFQTFNTLIQSLSTEKPNIIQDDDQCFYISKTKAYSIQLVKILIEQLNQKTTIIFKSTKINDQLKIQSCRTLFRFIQIFKQDFNQNQLLTNRIIDNFTQQLKTTSIIQSKNYCIIALKLLICKERQFTKYLQIINLAIKWTSIQNIKLSISAYKFIKKIINIFPQQLFKSQFFQPILHIIKNKLKQHDADKIIKQNVVKFIGPIFQYYLQRISIHDQRDIISSINIKLKIQIDKSYLLDQFQKLPANYSVKKQNIIFYKQTLEIISNNLGSSNAELNYKTINAIHKIINILNDNLDSKTVQHLLSMSKALFNEYKIPSFMQIIIKRFPNEVKKYSEYIVKSTNLKYLLLLIETKIISYNQCIKILKTVDRQQNSKNINSILAKIGANESQLKCQIDQSKWGLICLGTLGYVGNISSSKYLIQIILSQKNQQFRLQAASSLGNIASRQQNDLIQTIIQNAQKSQNYYIFIYSIKEYLNFKISNTQTSKPIPNHLIGWLFHQAQSSFQGQSIYHLISECIGKIAFFSNQSIKQIINLTNSQVQNQRFVIANSLKFYFQGSSTSMQEQLLLQYVKRTIELIADKSVNIRTAVTKSLNSISSKHYAFIQTFINQNFWLAFLKNLQFDDSLIIEVDYGISKEKKDLGKALRLQSFIFLKFVLKNTRLDSHLIDDLILVSLNHLNKQNNPDLVLKRLYTVRKLCYIDITQFISHIALFIQRISVQQGILKSYMKKTTVQDQRIDIYLKEILKEISLINKIAEKQNIQNIRGYITSLKVNQRFASLFNTQQLKNAKND